MDELGNLPNLRFLIGDIREEKRLDLAFENVDVIFHAAALKHVPLSEYNPFEAVKTNIVGSQNVIDMARRHNVDRVIAISTDKAVNPTSVMGTSKLMMEKLVLNANQYRSSKGTRFSCVRFGNIAWSTGSVLQTWKKQMQRDNSITITDPEMTRFFISESQAAKLVLESARLMKGGEIFLLKMPAITLGNLAKIFIEKYGKNQRITCKNIGHRIGEKKHEELFLPQDQGMEQQIFENAEMFIVVPRLADYTSFKKQSYSGFTSIESEKLQLNSQFHIDDEAVKNLLWQNDYSVQNMEKTAHTV